MKKYNVRCPFCGHVNTDLYLEETEGLMECIGCGEKVNALDRVMTIDLSNMIRAAAVKQKVVIRIK